MEQYGTSFVEADKTLKECLNDGSLIVDNKGRYELGKPEIDLSQVFDKPKIGNLSLNSIAAIATVIATIIAAVALYFQVYPVQRNTNPYRQHSKVQQDVLPKR